MAHRKDLKELGEALIAADQAVSGGVSATTWGTKMTLAEVLDLFLTDGTYKIGRAGHIVVPDSLDFVHVMPEDKPNYWRLDITSGHPYFEGKGLIKFIDSLGGTAKILSIDVHQSCRYGEINIQSWPDWPFEIRR